MSGSSHDLGIEIKLGLDCLNSDEQTARYKAMSPKRARRAGMEPGRPILAILNEFMDEKISRVMKQDPWDAFRALRDLRRTLESLVHGIKHPELRPVLKTIEDAQYNIAKGWCQILVKKYRDLSTPREELPELNALLVECIELGWWPTWREDIDGWGRDDDRAA
jgi:hypothetical protein